MVNILGPNKSDFRNDRGIKLLILYDEKIYLLGDFCLAIDKIESIRSFFHAETISINFVITENRKYAESLLYANPFLNSVTYLQWEQISFADFDVVLIFKSDENKFQNFLNYYYSNSIKNSEQSLKIYSLSGLLMDESRRISQAFPENSPFNHYLSIPKPRRLYLEEHEISWARSWLVSNGLRKSEKLIVIIDSSTIKSKLLNTEVYKDVFRYILRKKKIKILIFDENNIEKEKLYSSWLGEEEMSKIIFSKGLTLRQDLCLIGSGEIEMIFGPCSGLMHCSSGIYNRCLDGETNGFRIPKIIVYTGLYNKDSYDLNYWWNECPLVSCLLLKKNKGEKKIVELNDLSGMDNLDRLPCDEYTSELIINYLESLNLLDK